MRHQQLLFVSQKQFDILSYKTVQTTIFAVFQLMEFYKIYTVSGDNNKGGILG